MMLDLNWNFDKLFHSKTDREMNKITSSWPQVEADNYIEIVDLVAIDRAFKERNIVLLSGVEGSGKTTLAIKYAKQQSETDVVVWFAAESARKIDDRLQRILADDLKLDPAGLGEMQERARVETVVEHVRSQQTKPHLFVFDDIGREGMLTVHYFLDSSSLPANLRLLLTSASGDLKGNSTVKVVKMEPIQPSQAEKYYLNSLDFRHDGFSRRIFEEAIRTAVDLTPYRLQASVAFLQLHIDKNNGIDYSDLDKMIDRLKRKDISESLLDGLQDHAESRSLLEVARYLDTDALAVELVAWIGLVATDTLKKYRVVSEFVLDNQKYLRVHRLLVEAAARHKRPDDKKIKQVVSICLQKLASIGKAAEDNMSKVRAMHNQLPKLLEAGMDVFMLYDALITIEEQHTCNYRRAIELMLELRNRWLAKRFCMLEVVRVLKRLRKLYETMGNESEVAKVNIEIEKMVIEMKCEGTRRFEDFEFRRSIKTTNYSEVWKAVDKRENTKVAIKVVANGTLELENIQTIQRANPPFVVQFLGHFIMKKQLFVVMEFCRDGDLRSKIEKKIDDKDVENWSWELMLVLIFMQRYKIVHNDIKPENILIDAKKNSIKVADFGEAQIINEDKTVSDRSGTNVYMAPERQRSPGKGSSSTASDIWACAIVFYEMIYQKRQFEAYDQWLKQENIFHDDSELGVRFKSIFEGIFREKPEDRLQPEDILKKIRQVPDDSKKAQTLSQDQLRMTKLLDLIDNLCRIANRFPLANAADQGPRIERKSLDDKIKQKLQDESAVILEGVVGAGKSDLAAEIARNYGDKGVVVVWVNAASQSSVDGELQRIIVGDLEFNETKAAQMNESARVAAIHKHVKSEGTPHLIVLVNVQQASMPTVDALVRAIPANLKLLITTIGEKLKTKLPIERLRVDPIDRTQAEKYFRESLGPEAESGTLRRVLDELFKSGRKWTPGELRTAVATAKIFMDRTEDSKDPRRVEELVRALAKANISDATLGMLKQDAGCQRLLELARYLETDEIAFELLALLFDDFEALDKALKQLKHYQAPLSEFSINERKFVKMDRMLVEAVRKDGKPDEATRKRVIGVFLAQLASIDEVTAENRRLVQIMRNHVFKLLEDKKLQPNAEVFSLYERLIVVEKKYTFNLRSARELGLKLLELKRAFYKGKPGEASVAASLNEFSETLMSLGEFAEVIRLQSAALEVYRKLHKNAANKETIRCLNSLGLAYAEAGNHQEAIAKHTETLEMNRTLHGATSDNPDTAASLNNLATALDVGGRLADAFPLYYEALEMYRRVYGSRPHPTIALVLRNLGTAYSKTRTHMEALGLFEESLRVYEEAGVKDESTIAAGTSDLALACQHFGQFDKAIELFTKALEMYRRVHRDERDHEDIATGIGKLAVVQESVGNYQEALKHFESLLEFQQQKTNASREKMDECLDGISRLKGLIEKHLKR